MRRLTWLTKKIRGALDDLEVAITVCFPPSVLQESILVYEETRPSLAPSTFSVRVQESIYTRAPEQTTWRLT